MVKRKGRLPREPKVRQFPSTDKLASGTLRLRRVEKLTDIKQRAPAIDYAKIQERKEEIIEKGKEIEQMGAETEQNIIEKEQALRERVLPPEEYTEHKKPSLIERLPERIPEPPKIEKHIKKAVEVATPKIIGVAKGVEKFVKEKKLDKKFKESDYGKITSV